MTKHSENTEPSNSTKPVLANRLFKFRAWVKEQKRMIKVFGFNEHSVFEQTWDSPSIKENIFEIEDCHIMQFTGLNDKNGIEIYEGDIVKYKEWKNNSDELAFKTNYIVCFEQLKWVLKHTSGRYQVTVQQHSGLDFQSLNNDGCKARNFKVIGNIYENPELLQTTS